MLVRDQRGMIYAYAGPPSIQMAAWGDRGGPRPSRARSAHHSGVPDQSRSRMFSRSISAGPEPGFVPPIPPPPVGYAPHPGVYHQPVVIVPQPYGTPVTVAHPAPSPFNRPIMMDKVDGRKGTRSRDSSGSKSRMNAAYHSLQYQEPVKEKKTSSSIGISKKSSKDEKSHVSSPIDYYYYYFALFLFLSAYGSS